MDNSIVTILSKYSCVMKPVLIMRGASFEHTVGIQHTDNDLEAEQACTKEIEENLAATHSRLLPVHIFAGGKCHTEVQLIPGE